MTAARAPDRCGGKATCGYAPRQVRDSSQYRVDHIRRPVGKLMFDMT